MTHPLVTSAYYAANLDWLHHATTLLASMPHDAVLDLEKKCFNDFKAEQTKFSDMQTLSPKSRDLKFQLGQLQQTLQVKVPMWRYVRVLRQAPNELRVQAARRLAVFLLQMIARSPVELSMPTSTPLFFQKSLTPKHQAVALERVHAYSNYFPALPAWVVVLTTEHVRSTASHAMSVQDSRVVGFAKKQLRGKILASGILTDSEAQLLSRYLR